MRILHVTDCYLPRLGGIETHVHDLALRQLAAGHDVRVLTTTPADPAAPADPPWVRRVEESHTGTLAPLFVWPGVARLLTELAPEVVHVHVSVLSPFASVAARQASALGLPTLVTVHSLWTRLGPLPALADATLGLRGWPVHWSTVSERAAEPLRQMLGPDVPVSVLSNAVDAEAWLLDVVVPAVPTVLSVMRLARIKRPLPLARMLRDVRAALPAAMPLRAVIIGDGPQRGRLENYLARHRMSEWVELPGRLDRTEVRAALASASLYVAPAELESFGIAVLEARCAGLPVVASSRGGVGEFITHGVDGLLGATDAELVAAMSRLLTDEPGRAAMADHNRRVDPGLGWDTAQARTGVAYERAAHVARVGSAGARRARPPLAAGVGR